MSRVVVVGGYGNAGKEVVELLVEFTDVVIDVAGRDGRRARAFVDEHPPPVRDRLRPVVVDAADEGSLGAALTGCRLVVLAAGTPELSQSTAAAALEAGADYFDIQVGEQNLPGLRSLETELRARGLRAVTQGGFHPGVPAVMVRHVAARSPGLETARVGSVIALDWGSLGPFADTTVAEMMAEFRNFGYQEYRDGRWQRSSRSYKVDFPAPFGRRACAAMSLAEMHVITEEMPDLVNAGFYVGGFNTVVDYAVLPAVWLGMKAAPQYAERPLGRLLQWGLVRFSSAPFGTVLQLDGAVGKEPPWTMMRLSHPDGYFLTAAAAVATIRQLLDSKGIRPGLHLQAMFVETDVFFSDLEAMGVTVEVMCR